MECASGVTTYTEYGGGRIAERCVSGAVSCGPWGDPSVNSVVRLHLFTFHQQRQGALTERVAEGPTCRRTFVAPSVRDLYYVTRLPSTYSPSTNV
jgi:hypothetical protein